MLVIQSKVAVQFNNAKVHSYVLDLLTNAKIDWKDANLHNEAINAMMTGEIVPLIEQPPVGPAN